METRRAENGLPPDDELPLNETLVGVEGLEEITSAVAVADCEAASVKCTAVEQCIMNHRRTEDVATGAATPPKLLAGNAADTANASSTVSFTPWMHNIPVRVSWDVAWNEVLDKLLGEMKQGLRARLLITWMRRSKFKLRLKQRTMITLSTRRTPCPNRRYTSSLVLQST